MRYFRIGSSVNSRLSQIIDQVSLSTSTMQIYKQVLFGSQSLLAKMIQVLFEHIATPS